MRILKVTQAYYPFEYRGGPAVKVRSIASELVAQGNQVTVLTADLGIGGSETLGSDAERTPSGWRGEMAGVETIYLSCQLHYRNLTVNPGVIGFCRSRLKEFDLVHIYGLYDVLGPAVGYYCRRFRIPYVIEPLGMTRPIDRGFLLKKIWWKAFRGYLPGACQVIATSEMEKEELLTDGYAPNRVTLRYNGINPAEFRELPAPGAFLRKCGLRDGDRFVLFLGRIIPRKGADLLIEAMSSIPNDSLKLVLAGPEGEAGYIGKLKVLAHSLGVAQRVVFAGPLYGEEKKAALMDAWVFALPSRYENFGNTVAEAIACGTPAIVSDRCGIAPLIDQRAGLVTAYSSRALARTLRDLDGNRELYDRLKLECRGVAKDLGWQHLVRELQDSYESARNNFLRPAPI